MAKGIKTVQARLYDNKRRTFRVGDRIRLLRRPDGQSLMMEVIDLHVTPSFSELFEIASLKDFGFDSVEHGLSEIRKYYPEDDELRYGVVGIRVRLVE